MRCISLLFLWLVMALVPTAYAETALGTPLTQNESLESQIEALRVQVRNLEAKVEAQKELLALSQSLHERAIENLVQTQNAELSRISAIYTGTVNRLETLNLLFLGIFTVIGLVTGFLGYSVLRQYLSKTLFDTLKPFAEKIATETASKSAVHMENQARELVIRYETLFAEKYRQYSQLGGGK